MISLYRIAAIIFRHLMTMRRISWIIEITYWTILDIIVFGSLGTITAQASMAGSGEAAMNALITNSVLWYVVFCSAITIGSSLLNELFDANLISLFSTPLQVVEWIIATTFVGSIAALINVALGWIIALLMFDCNIFALGFLPTIAIIGSLLISSWGIGLVLMSVLLFIGKKGSGLAFVICWSLLPFSCIYYPIHALPKLLQLFSFYVPMAHVFGSIRDSLATGTIAWHEIGLSFALNGFCIVAAILIFVAAFKKTKKSGLARLELGW